jgi:hypothetical protein
LDPAITLFAFVSSAWLGNTETRMKGAAMAAPMRNDFIEFPLGVRWLMKGVAASAIDASRM